MADSPASLRIGVVAGEVSGDRLGASMIEALRARVTELDVFGMAGPEMIRAGCRPIAHIEELSVMGLAEVVRSYPRLVALRARLARQFIDARPDVMVGIDVPDFNLGLERRVRAAGIATVHWVCPQVWAWRPGRTRGIAHSVDHLLALFPFEAPFFADHGIHTSFVGHPLADKLPLEPDRQGARTALGCEARGQICAIMPGSRDQELRRHLQPFSAAARLMHADHEALRFVVCVAHERHRAEAAAAFESLPATIVVGLSHQALTAADVALLTSGTVSLEALLCATPMVVAYRMAPLSYHIIRRMVRIPRIGLPNILSEQALVPEVIQDAMTPRRLADETLGWLRDGTRHVEFVGISRRLHREMRRGAAARAAEAVLETAGAS